MLTTFIFGFMKLLLYVDGRFYANDQADAQNRMLGKAARELTGVSKHATETVVYPQVGLLNGLFALVSRPRHEFEVSRVLIAYGFVAVTWFVRICVMLMGMAIVPHYDVEIGANQTFVKPSWTWRRLGYAHTVLLWLIFVQMGFAVANLTFRGLYTFESRVPQQRTQQGGGRTTARSGAQAQE